MDYRQIIGESWNYTQKNKALILWYGFFSSILTTTFSIGYIVYQIFAFKSSYLFDNEKESFLHQVIFFIFDFIKEHVSWTLPLVIVTAILAVFYLLYPTLAKAAAIQMIARNRNNQPAGVGAGLRHGIMSFLPLLEYHTLIATFSIFAILIEMAFVLRNLGPVIFNFMMPVFLLLLFISVLLTLLFTYSDFYIVIDNKPVFTSMKESAKLVITNWKSTFLVTILMIIIGVRIVLQAFFVLAIPTLIIVISGYLATLTFPITGVIVGGVIGLVGLVMAAYLNGIVDIFSYTVWTFTFLDLTSEKEVSARDVSPREEVHEEVPEIEEPVEKESPIKEKHYEGHENL